MSPTELAYIAGLVDADGWISFRRTNNGTEWGGFTFLIGIVNRNLPVLEWVRAELGGKVRSRTTRQRSPHARNWSQTYDWLPDKHCVGPFLKAIRPYLRIKAEQADLLIEFLDSRQDRRKQYRLDPIVKGRREEIFQKIRQLNHSGVSPVLLYK